MTTMVTITPTMPYGPRIAFLASFPKDEVHRSRGQDRSYLSERVGRPSRDRVTSSPFGALDRRPPLPGLTGYRVELGGWRCGRAHDYAAPLSGFPNWS